MARAERIDVEKAVAIFEARITCGRHATPNRGSPHLLERDVGELFFTATGGPYEPLDFIQAWMGWQADRKGFGYTVLDVTKAEDAADFAVDAILHGLMTTSGSGATRMLRRASPGAMLYERGSEGGRYRLPPRPPRVPGSPRLSVGQRHAVVVRPVVADILRGITDHPKGGKIPMPWILYKGIVPGHLGDKTFLEARDILEGLHEDMGVEDQLQWLSILRGHLLWLGDPPAPEVPMDDLDALMAVA